MKIISINVSLPRDIEHDGTVVRTGIFKASVKGSVMVRTLNLDGDGQADLKNHGGEHKAVYAYPYEHYAFWQQQTGRDDFKFGQFGENLTTEGMNEANIFIGDVYRFGGATLQVTQPRIPCSKLGIRMNDRTFPKQFSAAERSGFYLCVLEEGPVNAGDAIEQIEQHKGGVSVRDVFHLVHQPDDVDLLARAVELDELPVWMKDRFRKNLKNL